MLFNSATFVFAFLPVFLTGFFLLGHFGFRQLAIGWAVLMSLVFYGWDDPLRLTPLIVASIWFNYWVARLIARNSSGRMLFVGVAGNLLLLGYFKYASLLLNTFGLVTGFEVPKLAIVLPIGISFFTFTQIAFLVDNFRREAREYDPLKYGLFVTYFPHLIAGPILHHKETIPQFDRPEIYSPDLSRIALGLSWFTIGLFKKVILADNVAPFVDGPFKAAASHTPVAWVNAWIGTASYSLQIYFDFSGYSDMAIGLALMIGIVFPLNFNSPYKAASLIDFWRRWHITLSRFLRDYLYIPLGGNRKGSPRRYANLFLTMVLGGLWHGASWNFALWGAIHGLGLAINHLWRNIAARLNITMPAALGWALTALLVLFAWVPFRADTFGASWIIWKGMVGLGGPGTPAGSDLQQATVWIVVLSAIAVFAPNTQEILSREGVGASLRWRPSFGWSLAMGCMLGTAVAAMIENPVVFLYFRF
jgi:D-alanyl-lipoteichoic acid acyltransferase DltB (MBOAT superfamily)